VPSGFKARVEANLAALRVLRVLEDADRPGTPQEQTVLAGWSSWGAISQVFDGDRDEWAAVRGKLEDLLGEAGVAAARRTTLNAHFTDPAIVDAMWTHLRDLGFDGGRVLEPGCGSGTFLGLAPEDATMTGVELDPASARIAAALYPRATVRAESFAETRLPGGYFDATIGNVPFSDVKLHDPRHNSGHHALHNHFIIKSLNLTRPGGMVAVLTSRYTLDAANPAARREMNGLADLVGAVRLPTGAHRRTAGTEAVTDLLVFRRREPDTEPASTLWETVTARRVPVERSAAATAEDPAQEETSEIVRVNAIYDEHPERILGDLSVGHGMHNALTLHVRTPLDGLHERLVVTLNDIAAQARRNSQLATARTPESANLPAPRVAQASEELWEGHLSATGDGFTVLQDGVHQPLTIPRSQAVELRALLQLRDDARTLLSAEAASLDDTAELDTLRSTLRRHYEGYVSAHGPINRFTERSTGRLNPETGEMGTSRVTPRVITTLRRDPFAALVLGLENFDEVTRTATAATIMSRRVVVPRAPRLGADTAKDALAIVQDTFGRVELAEVARLLGVEEDEARVQLGTLVYDDPISAQLLPATEYLSGDVREKLEAAETAAAGDVRWQVNVDALREVLPADLGPEDVEARLGAAWIDEATHQDFVRELLKDPNALVEHPGAAVWGVRSWARSVEASSQWGTERAGAASIIQATLEQRPVQVTDEVDDRRVVNPVETAAAQEKAAAIQERFAEWVWEDPERSQRLIGEYNRRFNSLVLRDYSRDGERLTLPGLVSTFTPAPHQRTAVARMLSEPAVGLFHAVGAGKTAEMVIGTMELRRLGMSTKPAVVVPNHMLEQFTREWLQLYPGARLLAASSADLAGDKRRLFVARAATNDWDAVLMTRSAFQRLPVAAATEDTYMQRETAKLRDMLERAEDGAGLTVKRIERALISAEQQLTERLDGPEDAGITFEQTGIDYLVVDEMHDYKNLRTITNIRDAAIDGSRRASDLHMKLEHLRSTHGERVITGATATPIANSVTEAHVMQRYLRPDLLEAAGVRDFDSWAATFGQVVTDLEMAPTGGGNYRMNSRFAKFQNVPEMLRMWHVFADVKTPEDLALPRPELTQRADGQRVPRAMILQATDAQRDYVFTLGERAEAIRNRQVQPEEDNMLKVSTDGRKAALDMRMVDPSATTGAGQSTKVDEAADSIARIWREHRDHVYLGLHGQPAPRTGALQIVFSDLGTPNDGTRFSAYEELRDQLVQRGLPADSVRFIHDAKTDADKGRLFAACRSGEVAVIIGSTQKMGVGTNIQARAIALHHLDCPWRPADLEQRDGRILRQGNQNPEISIYRWVTEGTFDAYSWQTVERKAKFIAQIMRGRLDVREMEDVGDNALSFAEVKALASGDPLVLELASAENDFTRLSRLERAHVSGRQMLNRTVADAASIANRVTEELPVLRAAVARSTSTAGEDFHAVIDGQRCATRAEAQAALSAWTSTNATAIQGGRTIQRPLGELAQLGGHTVSATATRRGLGFEPAVQVSLTGVPDVATTIDLEVLTSEGIGAVRRLENLVASIPDVIEKAERALARAERDQTSATEQLQRPFKHQAELIAARNRVVEVRAQMQSSNNPDTGPKATTALTEEEAVTSPDTPALTTAAVQPDKVPTMGAVAGSGSPAEPQRKSVQAAAEDEVQPPTSGREWAQLQHQAREAITDPHVTALREASVAARAASHASAQEMLGGTPAEMDDKHGGHEAVARASHAVRRDYWAAADAYLAEHPAPPAVPAVGLTVSSSRPEEMGETHAYASVTEAKAAAWDHLTAAAAGVTASRNAKEELVAIHPDGTYDVYRISDTWTLGRPAGSNGTAEPATKGEAQEVALALNSTDRFDVPSHESAHTSLSEAKAQAWDLLVQGDTGSFLTRSAHSNLLTARFGDEESYAFTFNGGSEQPHLAPASSAESSSSESAPTTPARRSNPALAYATPFPATPSQRQVRELVASTNAEGTSTRTWTQTPQRSEGQRR